MMLSKLFATAIFTLVFLGFSISNVYAVERSPSWSLKLGATAYSDGPKVIKND